jgi:hypothetical protein
MNVGDKMDARSLGHEGVDLKSLLLAAGYVMPQGSSSKLPLLPPEVQAEIASLEAEREKYGTLDETKAFACPYCGTANGSAWRVEVATGAEFVACGECHTVVEVR